jgi:steroid delta-isomerase-like uncharacterized protein
VQPEDIMAQATTLSPQALVTAAKAPVDAYNDKDWARAESSMTKDFVYDEVPTGRKLNGSAATLEAWKGWAVAFPDSKGTINGVHVTDKGVVVLELTWRGSHRGPLQTPQGSIAPTNRPIEVRACMLVEIGEEKARSQRHYFDMATLFQQIGVKA